MKNSVMLAAVFGLVLGSQCLAAQGVYGAIGGSVLQFSNGGELLRPKQLIVRIGYNFNDYIGLGYESGLSVIEDQLAGAEFESDTSFVYLKGSLPINEHASLYILAGSAEVELTRSIGGTSVTSTDDDTGFGFGLETLEGKVRFFIDHVTYFKDNDDTVDSLNLGAVFSF